VTWKKLAIPLFFVLLACGSAFWLGPCTSYDAAGERKENPALTVSPESLYIGEVWEDRAFKWKLALENKSAEPIEIREFATSCSCLAVQPPQAVIPSGSRQILELTIDLRPRNDEEAKHAVRDFRASLRAVIDERHAQKATWIVFGRVRSTLSVFPPITRFWDNLVVGQPFPDITIEVSARLPLSKLAVECDPKYAMISVAPAITGQTKYILSVHLNASLPAGPFNFEGRLLARTGPGELLPAIHLPFVGRVLEDVQSVPNFISFGARKLGAEVQEVVVLQSFSRAEIAVEKVEVSGQSLSVDRMENGLHGLPCFRIQQRVSKTGNNSETVVFSVGSAEAERRKLPIVVHYFGLP
jgi:hypothetical protein